MEDTSGRYWAVEDIGWIRARNTFQKAYDNLSSEELDFILQYLEIEDALFVKYLSVLRISPHERRYFVTGKGYLGLGPSAMKSGDIVVILFGLKVPYVLRPIQGGRYQIVGEAYLHGAMDGEILSTNLPDATFEIY